jgi:hypothetical protein
MKFRRQKEKLGSRMEPFQPHTHTCVCWKSSVWCADLVFLSDHTRMIDSIHSFFTAPVSRLHTMFDDYGVMGKICAAFSLSKTLNLRKRISKTVAKCAAHVRACLCLCVRAVFDIFLLSLYICTQDIYISSARLPTKPTQSCVGAACCW